MEREKSRKKQTKNGIKNKRKTRFLMLSCLGISCCCSVSVFKDKHLADISQVKTKKGFQLICTVLIQTLVTLAFDFLNKLINLVTFFHVA